MGTIDAVVSRLLQDEMIAASISEAYKTTWCVES